MFNVVESLEVRPVRKEGKECCAWQPRYGPVEGDNASNDLKIIIRESYEKYTWMHQLNSERMVLEWLRSESKISKLSGKHNPKSHSRTLSRILVLNQGNFSWIVPLSSRDLGYHLIKDHKQTTIHVIFCYIN